jgi:hypothetical protein
MLSMIVIFTSETWRVTKRATHAGIVFYFFFRRKHCARFDSQARSAQWNCDDRCVTS